MRQAMDEAMHEVVHEAMTWTRADLGSFDAFVKRELERWAPAVKASGASAAD